MNEELLKAFADSGRLIIMGVGFDENAPIPYSLTVKGREAVEGAK
jgi:hypothetical protein